MIQQSIHLVAGWTSSRRPPSCRSRACAFSRETRTFPLPAGPATSSCPSCRRAGTIGLFASVKQQGISTLRMALRGYCAMTGAGPRRAFARSNESQLAFLAAALKSKKVDFSKITGSRISDRSSKILRIVCVVDGRTDKTSRGSAPLTGGPAPRKGSCYTPPPLPSGSFCP